MTGTRDRFGHPVDPTVGYARGAILSSAVEEAARFRRGAALIRARVAEHGPESIGIFTGNRRDFALRPGDLPALAEEWVGAALVAPALEAAIRRHLDAPEHAGTAVFNRGSAALIAAVLALARGGRVVSAVPAMGRSHPSLRRGAALAGARFEEADDPAALADALRTGATSLLAVTPVTSSLARMAEEAIAQAVTLGREAGVPVLLDDAYGARIRPVLHGGAPGFALGADLVVTNADKAGLHGPRAGILAGHAALVLRVAAAAAELGQEARAPIALGVLRGLEDWTPETLRREAAEGAELAAALGACLGPLVRQTDLGPLLPAEDVLALATERAGLRAAPLVPVEATAALGMLLLEHHGVLTTNLAGQPGAHPALRLKPTADALARCGGAQGVAGAVMDGLDRLGAVLGEPERLRAILLG
ncbi:MAG TPA: aminotransferase class I/II-fold pyridoxal phosphate-dependent enzyme [Acetobacteraceae bacterium]|nr:aminotransferase class I/II-fold pyridoxal phosphate-dependent enzyme [Acetobacteraceae bacterium]